MTVSYSTQRVTLTPPIPLGLEETPSEEEMDCPPSFLCPITQEIMTDPVLVLESGMVC